MERQKEKGPDQSFEARYLDFAHLPDGHTRDGKLALNKYSSILTNGHDFPGAQVSHVCNQ
jgi:dihydroxy-acid dehydratase